MKNTSSTTNSTATELGNLSIQETSSPTSQPFNVPSIAPSVNVATRPEEEGTPMTETTPTVANMITLFPMIVETRPEDSTTTGSPIPIDASFPQDEATTSSPVPASQSHSQATENSAPKDMFIIPYYLMMGILVSLLLLS
jgi:hypothetical protein